MLINLCKNHFNYLFIHKIVRTNLLSIRNLSSIIRHKFTNNCTSSHFSLTNTRNVNISSVLKNEKHFTVDTNVQNNVVLWKYENQSYFIKMAIFSVVQLVVLCGAGYTFSGFIRKPEDDVKVKGIFKLSHLETALAVVPVLTGILGTLMIWFMTVRSVKYIILNKGGLNATFITYHPLKMQTQFTVPVTNVSMKKSRTERKVYTPIKIKHHSLYYLLDRDGIYINPDLFDNTVGCIRNQ